MKVKSKIITKKLLSLLLVGSFLLNGFYMEASAQGEITTFTINITDNTNQDNKVYYFLNNESNTWIDATSGNPIDISKSDSITVKVLKADGVQAEVSSKNWNDCMGTTGNNGQRFDFESGNSYELNVKFTYNNEDNNPPTIKNPKTIGVNIIEGKEYLDTQSTYIKVDNIPVENNSVTVEQKDKHVISVLPQFGYTIITQINDQTVTGNETEGWYSYTVDEADNYNIKISTTVSSTNTVTWAYDNTFGEDGKVSNGTVKIVSATLPDGSNGIRNMNEQNNNGGLVEISPGSTVKVEIKPNYGYQFVEGSLNGNKITAENEVSAFTFTMPSTNLHLRALFTKTEDIINVNSAQVTSGNLTNGENIIDSGNLKLNIKDLTPNESDSIAENIKKEAGTGEILSYLNMNLFSVVNKGNQKESWENQLTNLSDELTITLDLDDNLKGKDGTFYVIREHEDNGIKSYKKIMASYDKDSGKITFATDKFSNYALVLEKNINTTIPENNACNADLNENTQDLINKVLTNDEKMNFENGEDVKVSLETSDITSTISNTDKELINLIKGNSKVGMYLDIKLTKQIGNKNPISISETNGKVNITLKVPNTLINTNSLISRTYEMIRIHNGVATIIPCLFDPSTGTISFESDQFSIYALTYIDQQKSMDNNENTETVNNKKNKKSTDYTTNKNTINPKTGDNRNLALWSAIFFLSGSLTVEIAFWSKKKRKYLVK